MHAYPWPRPKSTVDVALFTLPDATDKVGRRIRVGLTRRSNAPRAGDLALPGLSIRDEEEDLAGMAARVLRDLCGLTGVYLDQLHTVGGRDRDPAGWSVTTVYYALVPARLAETAGSVTFVDAATVEGLPFDHDELVARGLARIRAKAGYTTQPAALLADEFTFKELQEVYEAVLGRPVATAWFRRRMEELTVEVGGRAEPWLVPTGAMRTGLKHRPAALFRRRVREVVTFPQLF